MTIDYGMMPLMKRRTRSIRRVWTYAVAMAFCILALVVGIAIGLMRRHLDDAGLLANAALGIDMAILLRRELRREVAQAPVVSGQ